MYRNKIGANIGIVRSERLHFSPYYISQSSPGSRERSFLAATAAAKLLRGRCSGEVVACSRSFAAFCLSGLCMRAKTGSKIQCKHLKISMRLAPCNMILVFNGMVRDISPRLWVKWLTEVEGIASSNPDPGNLVQL